jgi:hypothetical protein
MVDTVGSIPGPVYFWDLVVMARTTGAIPTGGTVHRLTLNRMLPLVFGTVTNTRATILRGRLLTNSRVHECSGRPKLGQDGPLPRDAGNCLRN